MYSAAARHGLCTEGGGYMAKNLDISILLDYYGGMLTEKQLEVVAWYYNEDLSLAEIAEHAGITRQGVRDCIKRAEAQLLECEEHLGLRQRFIRMQAALDEIADQAAQLQEESQRLLGSQILWGKAQRIIDLTHEISF
jgi:predicted DNA-binding protein YlxM (UPF0122 family)